jgi:hypothetical protein
MTDGYPRPGIWIRVKHRFGPRMPEWFMAVHMLLFGYVMLLPTQTFNQPAFASFRRIAPEETLGWAMLLIGCLRIIGLVINGAKRTVTPQIRVFSASIGCLVWSVISYGFFSSDVVSTWLSIYPVFAINEVVNIYRAAHDQGEARHGTTV